MSEDFVSFSLAKKLKEKGYPQKPDNMSCMPYYEYDEVGNHAALCNEIVWHMSTEPRDTIFAAPAIHKVLKWLREEKNMHIAVNVYELGWFYEVTHYGKGSRSNLICTQSVPNLNEPDFDSYDQASIAGIEYVIDNLI